MKRICSIQIIFLGWIILAGCIYFAPSNATSTLTSADYVPTPELAYIKTPTDVFFAAPTKNIIPTMDFQSKNEILLNLFENNGGCQLPCYWGIMPGESSWNATMSYFSTFGIIYGPGGTDKIPTYAVGFEGTDMSPSFWVQDDIIKAIGTNSSWVQKDFDHSLSGLLRELGIPEQIWIDSQTDVPDNQPYYHLVLFYPSKGVLVELDGNAEFSDNYSVLCPQNIFSRSPYPPRMLLWNPKEKAVFNNFGNELLDDDLGWVVYRYKLIQDISVNNISNEEFYNLYIDPTTNNCINLFLIGF